MKRFKFKLEAVLKMRRLEEDNTKMELGKLLVYKTQLQEIIKNENIEIDVAFEQQEKTLKTGTKAMHLGIFPMITEGKKAKIRKIETEILGLNKKIETTTQYLAECRAQTKLMEKLREKEWQSYKKEYNKVTNEKIEEQVQNWLMNQKRTEEVL
jgi:flagellar FliJ protein